MSDKMTDPAQAPMTPAEFANKMRAIEASLGSRYVDEEVTHFEADKLMCDLLRALGYAEGVAVFQNMTRWYS